MSHIDASKDKLDMEYINNLPQPFLLQLWGGDIWWPVHDIEVQTGLLRIDVCGLLQVSHIREVKVFRDDSGKDHDPDDFYVGADRTATTEVEVQS